MRCWVQSEFTATASRSGTRRYAEKISKSRALLEIASLTFQMLRNKVTPSQHGWILTRLAYPSLLSSSLTTYPSQVRFLADSLKGTPMKTRSFASRCTLRFNSTRVILSFAFVLTGTQPCLLSDL